MTTETLIELSSPNRDSYKVNGYRFGTPGAKPSIAIVAGLTGHNIDQVFAASKIVNHLRTKCEKDADFVQGEVLVIPAVNTFALNLHEKYWPLDKTDIDTMFPGYAQGETTQRIAHRLFEKLKNFDYGVVLEGRKDQAKCIPYLKLLQTGYESLEDAKEFGFKFIHLRKPAPIETVSLNYNWQLWGVRAFSVVWGDNLHISAEQNSFVFDCLLRFLSKKGITKDEVFDSYSSNIVTREQIEVLKASKPGIFISKVKCGALVTAGAKLANIKHALTGELQETIYAPVDGVVTCQYNHSLIFQNTIAFRIAKTTKKDG